MSDPRKFDRADVVQVLWPTIGPHTAESIGTAAAAISELWRYLAHATHSGQAEGLADPADVYLVVGTLRVATSSAMQVMGQLCEWAMALSEIPALGHDETGVQAAETASDAGYALNEVMLRLQQVRDALDKAAQGLGHLYLADDDAEEGGR
ncbi:hypothetical protein [Nocardia sp. CC227C]|uniref:hypothetical protein n=1 Tax=Nocardia sp. CC227C TaxID=3044562 RepID=UPI00278C3ECC|nr:hypothetical protein [Nocardia sp. CC227C]